MAGGILDPKSIQDRLEKLVNQQVDQKVEGKAPLASPAAPKDPFEGLQNPAATPTPSAAAAPSAPAAEGTTPEPVTGTYEVSTRGDKRFSALTAVMSDGMTIEEKYMLEVKGYMSQVDEVDIDRALKLKVGDPRRYDTLVRPFKGKPNVAGKSQEQVNIEYDLLWEKWASENPGLIDELATLSKGKKLTDMFAKNPDTPSQARSLEKILAKRAEGPTTKEQPASFTATDPSEFAPDEQMGATNEALFGRAPSPQTRQTVVGTPPPGETGPSVAQTGLPEASTAPAQAPKTQVTATTPTDQPDPFSGITDPALIAGNVPPEDVIDEPIYEIPETGGRRIAVIGTAGRKEKAARLRAADFDAMVAYLAKAVQPNDTLISGGAAYADHAAVRAYLDGKVSGLVLHLPAEIFETDEGVYKFDNAGFGTAGAAANYYHNLFAQKLGLKPGETIKQIQEAIDKGAVVTYGDGTAPASGKGSSFLERNTRIASDADYGVIAFDFDVDGKTSPADGGTGDTWRKHGKMHKAAKRRLVDIRKISVDDTESDRINSYNERQADIAATKERVSRLAETVRASDLAQAEKIDLLGKLTSTGKSGIPSERDIDAVLSSLEKQRNKVSSKALIRSYLPIQKLVSAAILIGLADSGKLPMQYKMMLDAGEIPNIAFEPGLDPDAALVFLRTRALQHSIERGTGERARPADRILHNVLMSLGIPEESLQPLTPYRPIFTTSSDPEDKVVSVERSNNTELAKRIERIKGLSAKLGPLMSHPEVAKPIYTITELLRGVESDIGSEQGPGATMNISRLRRATTVDGKMPYLKAIDELDPIFDYIYSKEYLMQRVTPDVDPYATTLAMLMARSLPPATRGEGVFAYDEAQLKETYDSVFASSTDWRRYAFDIGGEVTPYHMDIDEFGVVTDKFDGFQNKYADYAMDTRTYGVPVANNGVSGTSRSNRSRATIGMHVSTDASAGINWGNRAVDLEVHVVRAIKKLLADTPGTDIMPDTADELAIIQSQFMPYTRDAQAVVSVSRNVTTSLNATLGKIQIVDTGGEKVTEGTMADPNGYFVMVGKKKFYLGKGFYAFRESDPLAQQVADAIAIATGESTGKRRISEPFSIGDTNIIYPASVTDRIAQESDVEIPALKSFSLTVDPVVHQTFQHGPPDTPLVRADGRPFRGDYRIVTPDDEGDSFYLGDVPDSHNYDDSNVHLIEFDDGLRFIIATPVPQGVLVDGVDLERDYLGDDMYDQMRSEMPMQLAGEASKAAERQRMLESGQRIEGEIAPTGRGLEYEAAAAGERESHFGQTYAFDELDTSAADEAADPLRKQDSRMQARRKRRMEQLGVAEGTTQPSQVDPKFDVSAFLEAESLTPENAATAKQIILDYMWILRLRVRDASQSTPRPKVEGAPADASPFTVHRGVALRRIALLQSLGFDDIVALHNAAAKGPAVLNAVISEVMDATGDDPEAASKVLSEIYRQYPSDDPRKLTSTRDGRFSYNLTPPRNDLEEYSTVLADELRRAMSIERGADSKRAKSLDAILERLDAELSAKESTEANVLGSAESERAQASAAELLSMDPDSPEFQAKLRELQVIVQEDAPYVTTGKPKTYTTKSGVQLTAETPAGIEVLDDIIARDEAGRLSEQVLNNATENMKREDAAYIKKNKIVTAPQPEPEKSPRISRNQKLIRFLQTADSATLRNVVMRAWAKYAEHMAMDGDYDSFVNVIRNGLKRKDQLPKALNFVMDKVGAVRIPDYWFTKSDGTVSFPIPNVKNPKYSSAARRTSAFDGVLSVEEMTRFVDDAEREGAIKKSAAANLRGVIRFASQSNKAAKGAGHMDRQLAFYIIPDENGTPRVMLTTSPTYASQKSVATPYRSNESGPGDFSTLEDASGRLQLFSAADLQKIITAVGADGALRVVPLPAKEGGILSQAQGIATEAEMSRAMPYTVEFADGTSIDQLVNLVNLDSLNLRGGRTPTESIVYRMLDASIRARFFTLLNRTLSEAGVTEPVITQEDMDNSPFVEREVVPSEGEVIKRVLAGQTEEEARKPAIEVVAKDGIEQLQGYEGPFSRARYGGSGTLSERPYKDTYMSPALRLVRDAARRGDITLTQGEADDLASGIDTVIEYKKTQAEFKKSGKTAWRPGARAGIIGGAGVGTLAAFLQYGADEKAKEAAIAALPSQVAFEALGAIPKFGGPAAAVTGLGLTYATGGDMLRALVGIGGSIAGGALGTGLGLFTGPGAFAAGLAGSTAGYMAADSIYSAVTGKSNTSPLPQNVADSNPVQSARLEIPTKREIQQTAPLPAVNRDIAKLEEMG